MQVMKRFRRRMPSAPVVVTLLVLAIACTLSTVASSAPAAAGSAAPSVAARANAPTFRLAQVRGVSFTGPVWVGSAPGSGATYYVVEQRGIVWAVRGTTKRRFLDLRRVVLASGEQGLLSLAFARDYARSGRFYVYFVAKDGNGRVFQYRARRSRVIAGSGRLVLRVPLSPPTATNHNGGNLWTTHGGQLLLSVGDGGGGGVERRNSQRMDVLMGKLLRITPRANGGYVIPRSNPFVHRRGARREIFALGLRNPWRFSIDDATGDIWIGDVGQNAHEEVDRLVQGRPAGANFGWPRMEGNALFGSGVRLTAGRYQRPFTTYSHAGGRCSITGGVVYRGSVTSMRGRYLYADFCSDRIWSVHPANGIVRTHAGTSAIVHFGTVAGGNVIVASTTSGKLYRMVAA